MKAALALMMMACVSGVHADLSLSHNNTACLGNEKFQVNAWHYSWYSSNWPYVEAEYFCGEYGDDVALCEWTADEEDTLFPLLELETWIAKDASGNCRSIAADGTVNTVDCGKLMYGTCCRFGPNSSPRFNGCL